MDFLKLSWLDRQDQEPQESLREKIRKKKNFKQRSFFGCKD